MGVLLEDIVSGAYPPRSLLPPEAELARSFGVSRGVARECMRGLEERGIVAVRHGRGATVNEVGEWDTVDEDVLAALMQQDGGAEILSEYLECRAIVEVEAARLAALHAGVDDLSAMADALGRMERSVEHAVSRAADDYYHEADVDFHRAIIDASGNRVLGGIMGPLHRGLLILRRPLGRPDRRIETAIPEHRRILAAIAAADADEAHDAMEAHLGTVARYLTELVTEERG
jgi:DNA-binding FadR family transcriptional regulator